MCFYKQKSWTTQICQLGCVPPERFCVCILWGHCSTLIFQLGIYDIMQCILYTHVFIHIHHICVCVYTLKLAYGYTRLYILGAILSYLDLRLTQTNSSVIFLSQWADIFQSAFHFGWGSYIQKSWLYEGTQYQC